MEEKETSKQSAIFPVSIKRGHSKRNLAGTPSVVKVNKSLSYKNKLIDLSQLKISLGWIPGKYHVILRKLNSYGPDGDWLIDSEISEPFIFHIV